MIRSLIPGMHASCPRCRQPFSIGHHEICEKVYRCLHVSRHDQVKLGLAAALKAVPDITVEVEPRVPLSDLIPGSSNPQRRNDIRLTGSAASGMTSADFDITITSLCGNVAVARLTSPRHEDPLENVHQNVQKRIDDWLDPRRAVKFQSLRLSTASSTNLIPLVFSSGGCTDSATATTLQDWKRLIAPSSYGYMQSRISVGLARARGLAFVEWSSICHRVYPSLLPITQASSLGCLTFGCLVQWFERL